MFFEEIKINWERRAFLKQFLLIRKTSTIVTWGEGGVSLPHYLQ